MQRVEVGSDLERTLRSIETPVEVVDKYGNVLGRFEPHPGRIPQSVLDAAPGGEQQLSRTIQEARQQSGRPLKAILADLPRE